MRNEHAALDSGRMNGAAVTAVTRPNGAMHLFFRSYAIRPLLYHSKRFVDYTAYPVSYLPDHTQYVPCSIILNELSIIQRIPYPICRIIRNTSLALSF
jgi:hypothetical protein